MPATVAPTTGLDVLSPRSTNVPMKPRPAMKKEKTETKAKPAEKSQNPDRIDDKWRPPVFVTEPGPTPEIYVTGKKLGKGGFAVCFEGTTQKKSEVFALKVVKAHIEQKKMAEKFRTEMQIHAKMCHPNIVEFYRAFTFEEHTYVILELCHNGNLTDMVKSRSCLCLPEVRRFMMQICGGVKYMHQRNVIHRDLKMGNIFLDSQMNIKIGDFGLAAVMADEQDRRTTLCGTPNYIAPEILSKSSTRGHDNKVDTWAVGVICYAMLMGTPPFQSKTQQEIYTKLKTLEYEWKIDSKNYIPQQAKDFVASCLTLVSAERPEMDDLVEHDFFKMGVIAEELDTTCLKAKPRWLEEADPRGDKVRRNYGIAHTQMCKDCGVGKTADGTSRPSAGEKANMSALVEIEAENRHECAPTVPLADDVVYKHFAAAHVDWIAHQKHPLLPTRPRSRKPPTEHVSKPSIGTSTDEPAPTAPGRNIAVSRPVQSFAAQQRQQALPARTASKQAELPTASDSAESRALVPEGHVPSREYLRERPIRAATVRSLRSNSTRDAVSEPKESLTKSSTISGGIDSLSSGSGIKVPSMRRAATVGRSASQIHLPSRPFSQVSETDDKATTRPMTASSEIPPRVLRPTAANDRRPDSGKVERTSKPVKKASDYSSVSTTLATNHKDRVISSSDPHTILQGSSSISILASLNDLHDSFSATPPMINSRATTFSSTHSLHPRVEKWVDYTTRHGIAYILSDDTVGVVLKSSEDNSRASSCVVVRNARFHAIRRAMGVEDQLVPQGRGSRPVEFYEPCGEEGTRMLTVSSREFKLDLKKAGGDERTAIGKLYEGCDRHGVERVRMVGLADKFGKYMNKKTGGMDEDEDEANLQARRSWMEGKVINFYQRLGNVGVWRFSDGGLQANFPDHTKVVAYQKQDLDGVIQWWVDLIYLAPEDARYLARQGVVTADALNRRNLLTLPVREVLQGRLGVEEQGIMKSNEINEKLAWIRAVVGCWIKEGGVGKMGDEKVGWSGLQERRDGSRAKLVWVCVGRDGGDADMESVAAKK